MLLTIHRYTYIVLIFSYELFQKRTMLITTTLLLLLLVGLCAATEYYVKPTTFQETSCPSESCYTLDELAAKYFYGSATDVLMDNVTVILLNGPHELKGYIFVKEINDFTFLGAGGINGEGQVEINCNGASSLVFDGIINLTITRITFLQCGALYQHENLNLPWHVGALTLFNVFNLRMTWVEIQNTTNNAIIAVNVLGASVIDHSVFQSSNISDLGLQSKSHTSRLIYISYDKCNDIHPKCSNKTMSFLTCCEFT